MAHPTILIAGSPAWLDTVRLLLAAEYKLHQQVSFEGYMALLIDLHAALILVDGDQTDWQQWTIPPKASAATRRIPIIVISSNKQNRQLAPLYGADFTLSPAQIQGELRKIVHESARILDETTLAQLECDCTESLPALAQEGVRRFNAGDYYKQHDLFEELWIQTESPVRDLYRAILQVGIAYYQIERGNYRGALKMLQRSVQWLLILPDQCQGVDVQKLREDSFRVRAELIRLGESRFDEFDPGLIQGVALLDPTE